MKDTLAVLKSLANDPVPYVNTTVFLGLTAMQWDLMIKIVIGLGSAVWTYLRIVNEWKKYKSKQSETTDV